MNTRASSLKNGKFVISEKVFIAQIITLARVYKWKTAHFRPAQDRHGRWKTAVEGEGAGFPDLVLAHKEMGQLIFAELKSESGTLSDEQLDWGDALGGVALRCDPLVRWVVWRPADYDRIKEILSVGGGR